MSTFGCHGQHGDGVEKQGGCDGKAMWRPKGQGERIRPGAASTAANVGLRPMLSKRGKAEIISARRSFPMGGLAASG
jgi:hypothetical protein